jgi:hypothetical protein
MRHIEAYDGSDILCQNNGDKARFGKERKKKNLRRKRTNEYRLKIVHEDGTKELGEWSNNIEQVAQAVILTRELLGGTCWLLVRSITCTQCQGRKRIWNILFCLSRL